MNKGLKYAEIMDAWRVVPRISMGIFWHYIFTMLEWYTSLIDPTTGQTSVIVAVLSSIIPYVGWYQSTGRKWSGSQ